MGSEKGHIRLLKSVHRGWVGQKKVQKPAHVIFEWSHRKIRADLEATDGQDVFVSFPFPYRHYERFNETHEMMR